MVDVVFIHIPKTAGTSLRQLIELEYKHVGYSYPTPPFQKISRLEREELQRLKENQAIIGHDTYLTFRDHLGDDCEYFAMLRNPVDRVISYYNHAQSYFPEFRERKVSLLRFLDIPNWETSNLQVKYLCARPGNDVSNSSVDEAIDRIESGKIAIGIQEHFRESIQRSTLFKNPRALQPLERRNQSKLGFDRHSFNESEVQRVREMNSLDFKLYSYCLKRFGSATSS